MVVRYGEKGEEEREEKRKGREKKEEEENEKIIVDSQCRNQRLTFEFTKD